VSECLLGAQTLPPACLEEYYAKDTEAETNMCAQLTGVGWGGVGGRPMGFAGENTLDSDPSHTTFTCEMLGILFHLSVSFLICKAYMVPTTQQGT